MYQGGSGVAQDEARAAELYRGACDGGEALGCSNLGALFHDGIGVSRDAARALALYRQALELGLEPADDADVRGWIAELASQ